MSLDIDQANQTAVERMMAARPMLTGVATARDVIPGMRDNLLLHAGPPIDLGAHVRARCAARSSARCSSRGWPTTEAERRGAGRERARSTSSPATTTARSGPMAGVTSASMTVYVVENDDPRQPRLLQPQRGLRQGAALRRLQPRGARQAALDERRDGAAARRRARARRTASTCAPCWPRRCTWATRGTTATRPARFSSPSCWRPLIAAGGRTTPARRPRCSSFLGDNACQRAQPGDGRLQGDGRRRRTASRAAPS